MKKIAAIFCSLFTSLSVMAGTEVTKVSCEIYGPLSQEKFAYKTILNAEFGFLPSQIKASPRSEDGGCEPSELRSPIKGNSIASVEFIASKCGSDKVYVTPKVTINGLPILLHFSGETSRVVLNEDSSKVESRPLELSDIGKFRWIYIDCKKETESGTPENY